MSRVGNVYADLAVKFAKGFDIADKKKLDDGITLTVKQFDLWAMEEKEIEWLYNYDDIPRTAPEWVRLLTLRNDLRRRINKGAASEKFRERPTPPAFSVDVDTHGESYIVRNAAASYELLARRLPSDLSRVATTKKGRIDALMQSIDFSQLPPDTRLLVHGLDRHVRLLMKDVSRRLDDFNEEFAIVEELIAKLDLQPRNGGLIKFSQADNDDHSDES